MIDSTWLPTPMEDTFRVQRRTEIVPGVYVGDRVDARNLWNMPGWTIIDVREMATEAGQPDSVVRIPLLRKDTNYNAGAKALLEITTAIDTARAKGDLVLVHCWQGLERSPLSIVGWLVISQGYTLDGAYDLVLDKRGAWDRRDWLTKKARRALEASRP